MSNRAAPTRQQQHPFNAPLPHILVPVVAAVAVNAVVFALGWSSNKGQVRNALLPPGWVVGSIWVVLLGLLGYVHWHARNSAMASMAIIVFIVWCIAYPFLTNGLQLGTAMRVANTFTLVAAFTLTLLVHAHNPTNTTLALMAPLLVWATYVNITDDIGWHRPALKSS